MWATIARIILRNRIGLMIILGIITIFMGYKATEVQMSYKQQAVLPANHQVSKDFKKFSEEFGKEGDVIFFTIENEKFWELENLQDWITLGNNLKNIEGVDAVASVTHNTSYLKKNTKEKKFETLPIFPKKITSQNQIDSLKKVVFNIPFYKGKLYNESTNTYMMLLTVNSKIIDSKARIPFIENIKEQINHFASSHDYKIRITGLPYIRVETSTMIKNEMILFFILSIIVTATILFLFFRSFLTTLFSLLVVITAAIWSVGTMSLLGYEITLLTGMLPPLLIVIGIPNCVFLTNKYHSEFARHGNKIMALQRVIISIGNAIFLTNLTTAAGFLTFIITSSAILRQFGVVAFINILLLFVISIILIPSFYSMLPTPKGRHTKHLEYKYIGKFLKTLLYWVEYKRKWIYITTFTLLALSIWGILMLDSKGYVVDDLPKEGTIMRDLKFFEENYGGIMPFEVIIDTRKPKGVMQLSTLRDIDNLSKEFESLHQFSAPISIVEVAKFTNQAFYNGNINQYRLPSNKTGYQYLLSYAKNSVGGTHNKILKSYIDSLSQKTRLTLYMKDIGTDEMIRLQKHLDTITPKILPSDKYKVTMTGSAVVFYKGTQYLAINLMSSLALAIFLIALFMAFMFSSKRMVIIALIPNIIPLLVTAGLMGFLGIPLKASTILIFSIAFGISVDDTIHYLAKYRHELEHTKWNIKKAVPRALRETGQSMFYTSVILLFGFLIFSFSDFGGTKALGILVTITLFTAMFSNLILLPSMLLSLEKSISNKAFKRATVRIYEEENDTEEKD